MKSIYVVQPYLVGSKNGKSLALIIPARVAQEYNINPSTVFAVRFNADTKTIALRQTGYQEKKVRKGSKPTEQPFERSTQQAIRTQ
jgi:antitoxin component of MazEF toxin-antitoxin module